MRYYKGWSAIRVIYLRSLYFSLNVQENLQKFLTTKQAARSQEEPEEGVFFPRPYILPFLSSKTTISENKYLVKQLVLQMNELEVRTSTFFESLPWFHIVQYMLNERSFDQLKLYQANSLNLCIIIV